jgi:hypothetical protein
MARTTSGESERNQSSGDDGPVESRVALMARHGYLGSRGALLFSRSPGDDRARNAETRKVTSEVNVALRGMKGSGGWREVGGWKGGRERMLSSAPFRVIPRDSVRLKPRIPIFCSCA